MTSRERVLAAFQHKPTDRIPIHNIGFSARIASIILGREAYVGGGIQQWREAKALWGGEEAHREYLERSERDAFDISVELGHDILRLQYWRMSAKPTQRIDEYTFLYGDPEKNWRLMRFDPDTELYQVVEQYPPESEDTFESIEKGIAAQERSLESYHPGSDASPHTQKLMEKYGRNWVVRIGGGGLGIPYSSRAWLEAIAVRPDLVARYLDVQAERAVRSIPSIAAAGVKMIFGGGDFASDQAPFYSPQSFHDLMLPRLKRITDACHKHGLYYLFASDGNLWPLAEDLFGNSGVDGFYEIDGRAGMDLRKLRERFPHLVLIGNISSHTLYTGTKEDVIRETMSCLDEARRSGGIIIGVSNYILPGTPEENLWTMIETMKEHR
jgi:uroporphyrinogen decarboxylase